MLGFNMRSKTITSLLAPVASFFLFCSAAEESSFRDSRGLQGKYMMEKTAANARQGVLVFFHGSGGTNSYAANFEDLRTIAKEFKLLPIALQAPNGAITWAEKGPESGRVPYVRDFLKREVFDKYPSLDPKATIFVGFSAGSTFISGDFLPAYIQDYGGGAILLCGGAPPQFPRRVASPRGQFKMFVAIQPTDFLFTQTMAGVQFWRGQELTVKTVQPPGSGHCAFSVNDQVRSGIKFVLGR